MDTPYFNLRPCHARSGFTLVELLAVVGLIMILATVVGVAFSGRSGASALPTAQRIVASGFQAARSTAILNPSVDGDRLSNPRVRVIINNDPSDPDRYLRYFGTVIGGIDSDGREVWAAITQGTFLPSGLFFVPPVGGVAVGEGDMPVRSQNSPPNSSPDTMGLSYPRTAPAVAEDSAPNWFYYEFESTGRLEPTDHIKRVVIATGYMRPMENGNAEVYFDNPFAVTGFLILQSGSLLLYRDPDDIQADVADTYDNSL